MGVKIKLEGEWLKREEKDRHSHIDSRTVIVNKIFETLQKHSPTNEEDLELRKLAVMFEEKIYSTATSESDYLRQISLRMLMIEAKYQNGNSLLANAASNSKPPQDSGSQSMQPQMQNQVPMISNQPQVRQQLLPQNNMASTVGANSASMTSGLTQGNMPNIAGGQNPTMQNMQDMSTVNPNAAGRTSMGQQQVPFANRQVSDRQAQGQIPGQVMSGEGAVETGEWRIQLQADSRQRIVNKILDTLKICFPSCGQEEELKKIAITFEHKIYTVATSRSDYLLKISMKMLKIKTDSQYPMGNSLPANAASNSKNPQDSGSQSMQPQMQNRNQVPMIFKLPQVRQQLLPQNNLASTEGPNSGSITSGLTHGLTGGNMPNVAGGQNPTMQNMQDVSTVNPNAAGATSMGQQQGVPFANPQRQVPGRQQQQHPMKKQKLQQQGNIPQSLLQSQLKQQQQNLLQGGVMQQPSLRQSSSSSSRNQPSHQQQTQSMLQQQSQSALRTPQQQQVQKPQRQISMMQQNQQSNTGNMLQNQLIGQQQNGIMYQQQQRMMAQQNNMQHQQPLSRVEARVDAIEAQMARMTQMMEMMKDKVYKKSN